MINANELRIGNLVIDRHGNRIACTGVTICGVEYGDSPVEPIPLTPEILEKCGFSNKPNSMYYMFWRKGGVELRWREPSGLYFYFKYEGAKHVKIDYLHQLQNLYFALTGKELIINL